MFKCLIAALLFGFVATASAQGSAPPPSVHYGWAEVLRVDPVYASVPGSTPRQCYPQSATTEGGSHHASDTVLGTSVGGATANPAGKGGAHGTATVAGAAGGKRAGSSGKGSAQATQHAVCRPIDHYAPQQQIVAYDVEYRYRGEVYMSRLPYDPGERLRVRVTVSPAD